MNESAKIKKGDVVRLKSGGPEMTVDDIDEDGTATCMWFLNGEPQRLGYSFHVLEKVPAGTGPVGPV